MSQITLENVYKNFGASQDHLGVLRGINLTVAAGEFMVLVGPSGCGKSTLLRLIAGLETVSAGKIWVGERCVNDLPPKARDIAMVFQSYALYPHLRVYDNLAFGLRRTRPQLASPLERLLFHTSQFLPPRYHYLPLGEKQLRQQITSIAQMLQIESLLFQFPRQLSGGQKQRVALGRAMARNPRVFLMDEPLSNLDAKLRLETRSQIVQLQRRLGVTTLYVTHDQTEAMTMGDRIAVIQAGQIQQIGSPLDLYHRPLNQFVAEFIGSPGINLLPVGVTEALQLTHPGFSLVLPPAWTKVLAPYQGQPLTLGVRPEHVYTSIPSPNHLPAQVERIESLGSDTYVILTTATQDHLQVRLEPRQQVRLGDTLHLEFRWPHLHLFDSTTGAAVRPQEICD